MKRTTFTIFLILIMAITSSAQTVWTGAIDSDWFNPANWTAGIPTSAVNTTITGPPCVIANGSAATNSLTIVGGSLLVIDTLGLLDVYGFLNNNGSLKMVSSCYITPGCNQCSGSMIDHAGLGGDGFFEFQRCLLTGTPGSHFGWHYISSPVNNTVTADFASYWLKEWQEPNSMFFDIDPFPCPGFCEGTSYGNIPITVMRGYSVKQDLNYPLACPCSDNCWVPPLSQMLGIPDVIGFGSDAFGSFGPIGCSQVINCVGRPEWVWTASATNPAFMGNVNTGNLSTIITAIGAGPYAGFNLVGNPYTSGWDFNVFFSGPNWPAGLNAAIYYWDDDMDHYATYVVGVGRIGGTNFVPTARGLFVQPNGNQLSITLTCTNAEMVHTHVQY